MRSVLLFAWLCLATTLLCAQEIVWKEDFGKQGFATFSGTDPGNVDPETANSIIALDDGKSLVYVQKQFGFLRRLLADGSPDPTYSPLPNYPFAAARFYKMPDGSILLAGINTREKEKLSVVRLLPDGTAPTGFINLKAPQAFHYGSRLEAILPQPNNRVMLAVFSHGLAGNSSSLLLYLILPDGSADPSFGNNGATILTLPALARFSGVGTSGNRIIAAYVDREGSQKINVLAINQQGHPDDSFGNDGHTEIDFAPENAQAELVTLADGRMVLGGIAPVSPYRYILYRLLPNGQPDHRWGTGGRRAHTLNMRTSDTYFRMLSVDQRKGILVVGQDRYHENYITAARIDSNGNRDRAWGNNGSSRIPTGHYDYYVHDVSLAGNGSLQVCGYIRGGSHDYFAGRYQTSGKPDSSFGKAGFHRSYLPAVRANAGKTIALSNGSTLLQYAPNEDKPAGLLRLLPQGTPDLTFGQQGFVADATASHVDTLANGKIIQAHNEWIPELGLALVLTRRLANGSPDPTFGSSGRKTLKLKPNFELYHIWSLPNDQLVLAGTFYDNTPYNSSLLARLDAAGNVDPSFGNGGFAIFDQVNWLFFNSIARLPDGGLLAGGWRYNDLGEEVYALCRFLPSGQQDMLFGTDGFVTDDWQLQGPLRRIMPQPGGDFLALMEKGATFNSERRFYLARFDATGQRYSDFGLVQYRPEAVFAHMVLEDGRILELGYNGGNKRELKINGYTPNGIADKTFGNDGAIVLPLPEAYQFTGAQYSNNQVLLTGKQISPDVTKVVIGKLQVLHNQLIVQGFTLVDATSDKDLQPLADGATFNIAAIRGKRINIRANTTGAGSVVLQLAGQQQRTQTESELPYALFGNTGNNYWNWTPAAGNYTLTATPYSGTKATGTAGTPVSIQFTITDKLTLGGFTLVDANTNKAIRPLHQDALVDLSQTPHINIRANSGTGYTESIRFGINGNTHFDVENSTPFALISDNKGDYPAWQVQPGTYTITATPYPYNHAAGTSGTPATITIHVINSAQRTATIASGSAPHLQLAELQVYPNPVVGQATLSFTASAAGNTRIWISDASGNRVQELRLANLQKGESRQVPLDLSKLPKGMYTISVGEGSNNQVVQVIKQ